MGCCNNGCRRSQGHRRWLLRHRERQCQCHQQGATTIEVGDTKDPLCFAEIRSIVGRSVCHLFGQVWLGQQVCLICALANLAMSLSGETGPAYIELSVKVLTLTECRSVQGMKPARSVQYRKWYVYGAVCLVLLVCVHDAPWFAQFVCGTAQLVCKAVWSNRRTRWSGSGKRPRQEGDGEYTSAQIHKPRGKDAEIV